MGAIGVTSASINATCMLKGTQCRGENGAYALTQVAFDHDCYRCPNSARTRAGPDLVFFLHQLAQILPYMVVITPTAISTVCMCWLLI